MSRNASQLALRRQRPKAFLSRTRQRLRAASKPTPLRQTHWETNPNPPPDTSEVCLTLRGHRLYVRSPDVALTPHPHADAVTAFVLRLLRGYRLRHVPPVDPVFAHNLRQLATIWQKWWGLPRRSLPLTVSDTAQHPSDDSPPRTGLFFTGGVDSFFSLLQNAENVDVLIFVAGFDLPVDDTTRVDHAVRHVRAVGQAFGKDVWILYTNLRTHPPFSRTNWSHWHGAALALVGWLLSDRLDRLLISASYHRHASHPAPPWGTHWDTDKFWSGPGLTFHHVGEGTERRLKVARIADNPQVQRHLNVCWQNSGRTGNCGVCEKCARTRLAFRMAGYTDDVAAFAGAPSMIRTVEQLPPLSGHLVPIYRTYPLNRLPARLAGAVSRLIERST